MDWIKDIYVPDMIHDNMYPNVFMTVDDTKKISDLTADISKTINAKKSDWIMNGFSDEDWNKYVKKLDSYGMKEYLGIFQKYLEAYNKAK